MTHYQLRWRKRFLAVRRGTPQQSNSLSLTNADHLTACVQHAAVDRIRLDLDFDAETLCLWAEAGRNAKKTVYLRLPSALGMPQQQAAWDWYLKRLGDRVMGVVLSLAIAPLLLCLMAIMRLTTQESLLVTQWHVGERGRLFQGIKLRTQSTTGEWLPLGQWMWRYRLDRLPKIWHVLRGEMGLVGACPKTLQDVTGLAKPWQYRLNALPGLLGAWQIEGDWMSLDERNLNRLDRSYLLHWSPIQEVKFLLLALPMVLSPSK